MMNRFFLAVITSILLFSCKTETTKYLGGSVDFGVAEYYKPFWFSKSDTIILTKILNYDFNDYAKENKSFINIGLVDSNQEVFKDKNIRLFINGDYVPNNEFQLDSKISQKGELELGIQFLPEAPDPVYTGFLSFINHDLDIINENDLEASQENRIFEWRAKHKVIMNPLKKLLLIVLSTLMFLLLSWLIVLRPIVYRRFGRGAIIIQSPIYQNIRIKNKIKLALSNKARKQKLLNKLFIGKNLYYVDDFFISPIEIYPNSNNSIRINFNSSDYSLQPFATTISKGYNTYTIINNKTKEKLTFTYS